MLADHNQVHQSFWVVAVLQREHDERVGYGESNGGCGKEVDIGRGGGGSRGFEREFREGRK